MKIFLFSLAAFSLAFTSAQAQTGAIARSDKDQVCRITTAYSLKGSNTSLKTCDGIGVTDRYMAFAIDPTGGQLSTTPIIGKSNGKQVCYYLSNSTNTPYFIPANTDKELTSFLSHQPAGVTKVPCSSADGGGLALDAVALCGGKMVATSSPLTPASYTQGFNALGVRPAATVLKYKIINAEGQLLRTMTAVAKKDDWAITYDQTCEEAKARLSAEAAAKPTGFDRTASSTQSNLATPVVKPVATPVVVAQPVAVTTLKPVVSAQPAVVTPKAAPVATQAATPVAATPAVFNPATSGTQRVFITDGALARHIGG